MRPFRFGVQTHGAADGKAFRGLARQAESLGYSALYLPDHFADQWAPTVAMTIAAEATEQLKVGALVYDNDYRHPVVLAKEVATLDLATEGRVEFGIGAGWMRTDYEQSGIPYDSPGVRIDRLEEALTVMKALWADGKASFDGRHYRITDAQCAPQPHTRPHPPILIGGGGKRMLSLAAREADIIGVNANLAAGAVGPEVAQSAKAERFKERVEWIREAAGDRFDDIELQVLTFMTQIVSNARELMETMAPAFGMTADEAAEVPLVVVGSIDEICETLQRRREEYGFSYLVVQGEAMADFAPVVERLAGT